MALKNPNTNSRVSESPGRRKLKEALKSLLREKEFSLITWAEIASVAGVNEALIYKYFRDTRSLLFELLKDYIEFHVGHLLLQPRGVEGSLNKIRKMIWAHIHMLNEDKVFSRILLLEVRNLPHFFESEPYKLIRNYAIGIQRTIEKGVEDGEIRSGVSPSNLRDVILGAIEHFCLPVVLFNRDIDPDELTESLCSILFPGIRKGRITNKDEHDHEDN